MYYDFHFLEENLKEFMILEQKDSYNIRSFNAYKYNNLKISMDSKRFSRPHFTVALGISEGTFSLSNCEKMAGGLGPDERYIRKWYERANTKSALEEVWKTASKLAKVTINDSSL